MSRIIAGAAGGRSIRTPRGQDTRPTTDRVREALFSRVQTLLTLDGARVLDLYAGSGALGLEAASRGAGHVLAVERHGPTARLVRDNALALGLADRVQVEAGAVEQVLLARDPAATTPDLAYDLVLADPPYPLEEDRLTSVLTALVDHGWLEPDALVVVERSARSPRPTWPSGLQHLGTRTYGETSLHLGEPPA